MKNLFNSKSFPTVILMIIASTFVFYAFSGGITGRTRKPGATVGCTCHGASANTAVNVTINGPIGLLPGQTGNYTVTISGGSLNAAGTNIAASAGTLAPATGGGLQLISGELTHTEARTPTAGVVTFSFTYTAPSNATVVTLYANGNSVNNNGRSDGDSWNFAADKSVNVSTTGIEENNTVSSFILGQNFPNPFNPTTKISFELKEAGLTNLTVYSATGELVSNLVNNYLPSGVHSIDFNAKNLQSGVYFYRLNVNGKTNVKKMILNK